MSRLRMQILTLLQDIVSPFPSWILGRWLKRRAHGQNLRRWVPVYNLTNVVLASIKEEMSGTRIAIGYLPVSLTAVCNNPTALDYMQRIIPNLYQAVFQPCSLPKDLSFGIFQLAWHAEPTSWFGTAGFLAELWYSKTTKTRGRPRDQPKPPAPANNLWQPYIQAASPGVNVPAGYPSQPDQSMPLWSPQPSTKAEPSARPTDGSIRTKHSTSVTKL